MLTGADLPCIGAESKNKGLAPYRYTYMSS
jgi:hypothetical protein